MINSTFLLILLLFIAETSEARVFKWVDNNGVTHYSEATPEGRQAQEIQNTPAHNINESPAPPDTMMQQLESVSAAREARNKAKEQAMAARNDDIKRQNCSKAKRALSILQQQVPIFTVGENQERNYMEDETRAAEIKRMNEVVAENCE